MSQSSSSSSAQSATSKEERLLALKRKLIQLHGIDILKLESVETGGEAVYIADTLEEKQRKKEANEAVLAQIQEDYRLNEPLVIVELNKMAAKVRETWIAEGGADKKYGFGTRMEKEIIDKCPVCGNQDPDFVIRDDFNAQKVCLGKNGEGCGEVLATRLIHEGSGIRNFEDKEDRTHHGPPPNRLMSDTVNLEIKMVSDKKEHNRLAYTLQDVDMGESKIKNQERHTRVGYKVKQKREGFKFLDNTGSALNIHESIINKAKEYYAVYRDVKETVHKATATLLGCIVLAYEDLYDEVSSFEKGPARIEDSYMTPSELKDTVPLRAAVEDVAICTIPEKAMIQFEEAEVQLWLEKVSEKGLEDVTSSTMPIDSYVQKILQACQRQRRVEELAKQRALADEAQLRKKQKRDEMLNSSIFAGVNAKQRLAMVPAKPSTTTTSTSSSSASASASAKQSELSTFGLLLLRLRMSDVFPQPTGDHEDATEMSNIQKFYRDAIQRRDELDKFIRTKEDELNREKIRLQSESKATSVDTHNNNNNNQTVKRKEAQVESAAAMPSFSFDPCDNFNLDELIGGPIATIQKTIKQKVTKPVNLAARALLPEETLPTTTTTEDAGQTRKKFKVRIT